VHNIVKEGFKMEKRIVGLGCLILLICDLACVEGATCFGHTITKDSLVIDKGEEGTFETYLFNLCEDPLYVTLSVEYDPELSVGVSPREMTLESHITNRPSACTNCSWLILSGSGYLGKYARVYPARVHVTIPNEVSKNDYAIKLVVLGKPEINLQSGGFRQLPVHARELTFRVTVPGIVKSASATSSVNETRVQPSSENRPNYEASESGVETNKPVWEIKRSEISGESEPKEGFPPSGQVVSQGEQQEPPSSPGLFGYALIFLIIIATIAAWRRM
jgi:hypothetical protein